MTKINEDFKLLKDSPLRAKLEKLGYVIGKELGHGSMGTAYDIGGGKVLKITEDEKEALASSIIQKKPQKNVVRIHRVFAFKSIDYTYFIEQEKLTKSLFSQSVINEVNKLISNEIGFYLNEFFGIYFDHPNIEKDDGYKSVLRAANKKLENGTFSKQAYKCLQFMLDASKQLKILGIKFIDWHEGNIMASGSTPKVIDIGYSYSRGGKIDMVERKLPKLTEIING